jgi:signal transduction histidine kinase
VISDNGDGMDDSKKTTGIGLKNITGRLAVFNGTAHTKTAPGKGFTLEIEMPV